MFKWNDSERPAGDFNYFVAFIVLPLKFISEALSEQHRFLECEKTKKRRKRHFVEKQLRQI